MNALLVILLVVGLSICFIAAYIFAVISLSLGIAETATYVGRDLEKTYKAKNKKKEA